MLLRSYLKDPNTVPLCVFKDYIKMTIRNKVLQQLRKVANFEDVNAIFRNDKKHQKGMSCCSSADANLIDLSRVHTTEFGKSTFCYEAVVVWNSLTNELRKIKDFGEFKRLMRTERLNICFEP